MYEGCACLYSLRCFIIMPSARGGMGVTTGSVSPFFVRWRFPLPQALEVTTRCCWATVNRVHSCDFGCHRIVAMSCCENNHNNAGNLESRLIYVLFSCSGQCCCSSTGPTCKGGQECKYQSSGHHQGLFLLVPRAWRA